jgi:tRNA modification GTPase
MYIEAAIDFPDEEIDFLDSQEVRERLLDVQQGLAAVLRAAEQGAMLTRGLTIAIAGRPNAGKSTLMNALAGHDVAIVTPVPGTTRDLLRERIDIDGVPVELIDTAGLREHELDAANVGGVAVDAATAIEVEGMRRAREALRRADHVLFVIDAAADPQASAFDTERPTLHEGTGVTLVFNKADLLDEHATPGRHDALEPETRIQIAALTGRGLPELRRHIASLAGHAEHSSGAFSARARHVDALRRAMSKLEAATAHLTAKQGELAAFELREAQRELGEVVGDVSSDELLGEIFSSFCIGK